MLEAVFNEFSTRLKDIGQPVIAGGAVRDHMMNRTAKDYDFFLLGNDYTDAAKVLVESKIEGLEVVKQLEFHKSEPYLVVTVRWQSVDVQIMLNPAKSVEELVGTFDWNTCLFGYNGKVIYQQEDIANIAIGKELRLNKVTFPLSTLRRGFRFSERFGMLFKRDDILELCKLIIPKAAVGPAGIGAVPDMPSLAANTLIDE